VYTFIPPKSVHFYTAVDNTKGDANIVAKRSRGGNGEQRRDVSGSKSVSGEIDPGDQRSFATNSGIHSSPDPAPLEEHHDPVHSCHK